MEAFFFEADWESAKHVASTSQVRIEDEGEDAMKNWGAIGREGHASVDRLVPVNVPISVRQRISDAADEFMTKCLSAMAAIRTTGEVIGSSVNRVVQNGDEYLLFTQNGKIVPLRDSKMVRVFLMYVCNHGRLLTIEQIRDAELLGHWKLAPECHNAQCDVDGTGEDQDESRYHERDEAAPRWRKGSCGINHMSLDVLTRTLRLSIAQCGRDLKKAEAQGDQADVERIRNGVKALRAKLDETMRGRWNRRGPELSPEEAAERRRLQMTVAHIVELVGRKDSELACHLESAMWRDGRFGYMASPLFVWEVCENLLVSNRDVAVRAKCDKVPAQPV